MRKRRRGRREAARKLELGPRKLLGGGQKSGVRAIYKESVADKHFRAERKAAGGGGEGCKKTSPADPVGGGKTPGLRVSPFPATRP